MYIQKMGEGTGKRAAIYASISRDKNDDGDTLDGQIDLCRKWGTAWTRWTSFQPNPSG